MLVLVVGLVLLGFGVLGVGYAPAIVAAQRREGMAPFEDDETLSTADRVRVTRATGAIVAVVGLGCLAYGSGIV